VVFCFLVFAEGTTWHNKGTALYEKFSLFPFDSLFYTSYLENYSPILPGIHCMLFLKKGRFIFTSSQNLSKIALSLVLFKKDLVGGSRIELLTSSVSTKRSTSELTAPLYKNLQYVTKKLLIFQLK
jgi:hypothetical protein